MQPEVVGEGKLDGVGVGEHRDQLPGMTVDDCGDFGHDPGLGLAQGLALGEPCVAGGGDELRPQLRLAERRDVPSGPRAVVDVPERLERLDARSLGPRERRRRLDTPLQRARVDRADRQRREALGERFRLLAPALVEVDARIPAGELLTRRVREGVANEQDEGEHGWEG